MNRIWQAHRARTHFGEFLEASLRDGPQVVTRRGVETAVLVSIEQWRRLERMTRPTLKDLLLSIEQWRRLERMTRPTLKDLLLAPEARSDSLAPERHGHRHRATPALD